MTNEDMILEIAERLLLRDAENEALKNAILSQPNAPTLEQLERKLFHWTSRILTDPKNQQRSDELRHAFPAHTDADVLIHTLHSEVLRRVKVPL
jgi:hypothetical protein